MNSIETKTRNGIEYKHPSMVLIGVSRCNHGGKGASLFGSSIEHDTTICLTIKQASVERNLSNDWFHSTTNLPLIEIEMSPTQYAEMITNMNCGDGVPATLRQKDGVRFEYPVITTKAQQFQNEIKDDISEVLNNFKKAKTRSNELLNSIKPLSKAEKQELLTLIESLDRLAQDHLPFMIDQFGRQMEKTVAEAKSEVDAYVVHTIMETGIKTIKTNMLIEESK